jgi:hypothetical protein
MNRRSIFAAIAALWGARKAQGQSDKVAKLAVALGECALLAGELRQSELAAHLASVGSCLADPSRYRLTVSSHTNGGELRTTCTTGPAGDNEA